MTNELCMGEGENEELRSVPGKNTGPGGQQGRQHCGHWKGPGAGTQQASFQCQIGCSQAV